MDKAETAITDFQAGNRKPEASKFEYKQPNRPRALVPAGGNTETFDYMPGISYNLTNLMWLIYILIFLNMFLK